MHVGPAPPGARAAGGIPGWWAEAPREVGVVGILRDAAERVDGGDDAEAGGVLVPLADDAIEPDGPDVAIVRTRGRTELPALLVVPPRRGLPHRS